MNLIGNINTGKDVLGQRMQRSYGMDPIKMNPVLMDEEGQLSPRQPSGALDTLGPEQGQGIPPGVTITEIQ
jgi:hypothetical protein